VHEASFLKLDNSRAVAELGWSPRWHLPTALEKTAAWHAAWRSGEDMQAFGLAQIASYQGTNDR
jgi:CDP-glucose 4,6-dehydratase